MVRHRHDGTTGGSHAATRSARLQALQGSNGQVIHRHRQYRPALRGSRRAHYCARHSPFRRTYCRTTTGQSPRDIRRFSSRESRGGRHPRSARRQFGHGRVWSWQKRGNERHGIRRISCWSASGPSRRPRRQERDGRDSRRGSGRKWAIGKGRSSRAHRNRESRSAAHAYFFHASCEGGPGQSSSLERQIFRDRRLY